MTKEEIRTKRLALGLSQKEFARLMGISWATIARWEGGQRKPSPPSKTALRLVFEKLERQSSEPFSPPMSTAADFLKLGGLWEGFSEAEAEALIQEIYRNRALTEQEELNL